MCGRSKYEKPRVRVTKISAWPEIDTWPRTSSNERGAGAD